MDDYNLRDICRQLNDWVDGADYDVNWQSPDYVVLINRGEEIMEDFDYMVCKRLKQIAHEEGLV